MVGICFIETRMGKDVGLGVRLAVMKNVREYWVGSVVLLFIPNFKMVW